MSIDHSSHLSPSHSQGWFSTSSALSRSEGVQRSRLATQLRASPEIASQAAPLVTVGPGERDAPKKWIVHDISVQNLDL